MAKKKTARSNTTAGQELYKVRLESLPPGDYRRNQPWAELKAEQKRWYDERAERIAAVWNRDHASG